MWPDDYRPYGGTTADLAVAEAAVGSGGENVLTLAPGASFTVYDAATEGVQVTDLTDAAGAVISEVTADESGRVPRFYAPDSVLEVWLDSASGPRIQALPADNHDPRLKADRTVASIQELLGFITIDEGETPPSPGIWLARPAGP